MVLNCWESVVKVSSIRSYSYTTGGISGSLWIFFLVPPSIDGPAEEKVVETISNPVTFACDAAGIPPPSLAWLKNGRPIGVLIYSKTIYIVQEACFLFLYLLIAYL